MKRKSIEKALAIAMAVSVAITPMSSVSFAAEEDAVNATSVTQEEPDNEPAKEQSAEKSVEKSAPAPAANESSAPAASESSAPAPAASEAAAPAAEESAVPATNEAATPAAEAAAPAVEQKQAEAPKPAKSSYKVKIVLEDVMTASGPSTVTAVSSVTIKAGATKTYSTSVVNGWVKTKSVKYNGVTYKYANALKDASGNTITSLTIKAEDLDDDTTLTFRPVYTEVADMHVVVNFNNILQSNGVATSSTEENTLSSGSGWSFTQKKLDNKVVAKSFSHDGVNYKYTGKWVDENGNEVSSLSIKNNGEAKEVVYNLSPVYEMSYPEVLDFRYIDNISTGSGSWKNVDAFTTFSHKFKQPASKAHYKFVEWKNLDNGDSYQAGDTFKYTAKSNLAEKTVTSISIHALWQPSVTVEYYSNGVLVKSVESTEKALAAYDYNAADTKESKSGANFIGWYESAEEGAARVEEGTTYELPAVTSEPTEQKIIKLYANYTADYTVEHYTENLDGSFHLASAEEIKGAALGSKVSAEAMEFEGFTFDKDIEGTLTEAKAAKGLTLKFFYSRDSHNVTYEYEGDIVPEEAIEQLPAKASYKYEQEVQKADIPEVPGYVFSGWNGEVEKMPSGDVKVTGSWEYEDDALAYNANGGEGKMELSEGKTHNKVSVKENGFERYGFEFIGWNTEADGSGTAYEAGSEYKLTVADDELFAQWKVIKVNYSAEYYFENLDGEFELNEDETVIVNDVNMGSKAKAEVKEFTGFTLDESIEGTLTEAKAEDGLVLKLYYSRDSYDVAYEYVGDVIPEAADEQLPETVSYKFGQDVPGADDPQVAGFEFSGWDGEVESMPAENITVTGSWTEIPAAPAAGKQTPASKDSTPEKTAKASHKANVVAAANVPAASAQAEEIAANEVPQSAATVINDNETPLAQTGAWALINLICAAATALLSLIMMAVYFGKRRNEDEQIEEENISKVRFASMIPAIGAIIAFILTEDMSLPMAMVDKWTVLMIAILAIQAGVGIFAKLRDNEEYEEEDEARA